MAVMGWTLGIKVLLTFGGAIASYLVGVICYSIAESIRTTLKARRLWFVVGLIATMMVSSWIVWGVLPTAYYGQAQYIGVEGSKSKHYVEVDGRKMRLSGIDIDLYNEGDMVWVRCSGGGFDIAGCKLH